MTETLRKRALANNSISGKYEGFHVHIEDFAEHVKEKSTIAP